MKKQSIEQINVVELFIIHAKEHNILELDKNELRENFFIFKSNEKYSKLLEAYKYDENNICIKLETELNMLAERKQIDIYDKSIYIYSIDTSYKQQCSKEINTLVNEMVADYIQLNMNKQKVKVD